MESRRYWAYYAFMNHEIELKLRLSESGQPALIKLLDQLAEPGNELKLINQYFDTPGLALSKAGAALRIRQQENLADNQKKIIQTLKTRGQINAGLHQRMEWDWPLEKEGLDISRIQDCEAKQYLPESIKLDDIQPLFETNFKRRIWHYQQGESRVEVVLDQGQVSSQEQSIPLLELELELLAGEPEVLFDLAQQLVASVPMVMSDISKAERGYGLLAHANAEGKDWSARPPKLDLKADLSSSFKPLLSFELSNLQRALELGIWQQNPQAILKADWLLNGIRHLLKAFGSIVKRNQTSDVRLALDELSTALHDASQLAALLVFANDLPEYCAETLQLQFEKKLLKLQQSQQWGKVTVATGRWLYELELSANEKDSAWLGLVRKQLKQAWPEKRLKQAQQNWQKWFELLPKLQRLWQFMRYAPGLFPDHSQQKIDALLLEVIFGLQVKLHQPDELLPAEIWQQLAADMAPEQEEYAAQVYKALQTLA